MHSSSEIPRICEKEVLVDWGNCTPNEQIAASSEGFHHSKWQKRHTIKFSRDVLAQPVEQGRKEVDGFSEQIYDSAIKLSGSWTGVANDKWEMRLDIVIR